MIEALNYTPKAIADIMAMSKKSPPMTKRGLRFIAEKLRQAEVFVLPERGALLDRSKPRPQVPASVFRPPFPVVALEYSWPAGDDWQPTSFYNAVSCPRRIALAWEWDGISPDGKTLSSPEPGSGVAIASIAYYTNRGLWVPVWGAILTRYDAQYISNTDTELTEQLIRDGRTTAKHVAAERLEVDAVLTLMPEAVSLTALQYGSQTAFRSLSADIMDEANAYRDLCLALACNNVSTERHEAPARLNKRRIAGGKPPLKDFHVLQIAGQGEGGGFGDGSDGVRSHLRRGHIRRLGPERITWVNATMVHGRRPGFVDKIYAPKGARA